MKKISFFNVIFDIVIILALLILMVGISFVMVSVTNYDHKNESIIYDQSIPVFEENNVFNFNAYFKNENLYINTCFKEKKKDIELLNYAYTFMVYFNKNVIMECVNLDSYVFVNVCLDGTSFIV